jgi:hypothetical protein
VFYYSRFSSFYIALSESAEPVRKGEDECFGFIAIALIRMRVYRLLFLAYE